MAKAKTKPVAKPIRTRLPRPNWRAMGVLPSGSRYWQTLDGMFRLVCSETIDGVTLPTEWRLWLWKRGTWHRIGEARSRKRLEKLAAVRMAELESDE